MFKRNSRLVKPTITLFIIFLLTKVSTSFSDETPITNSRISDLDLISLSSRNSSVAAENLSISVRNSLNFIKYNGQAIGHTENTEGITTAKDTVRAMKEAAASAKKSAQITRETASSLMEKTKTDSLLEKPIENIHTKRKPKIEEVQILIAEAFENISIASKKVSEAAYKASVTSELETAIKAANETALSTEEAIDLFEKFQNDISKLHEVIVSAPSCDDEETVLDKWICEMQGATM